MDQEEWQTQSGLSKADFEKFTQYMNSNNPLDNRNRAILLGFIEDGIKVAPGANIRLGEDGKIGKHVYVGLHSYINGDVVVEDHVLMGPHCCLTSNNHLFNPESDSFRGRNQNKQIVIGTGSWLAAGVMVTGGVTIGRGTLVCANTVVTKDVPEYSIVAGTPGRVVGTVDKESGEYNWFSKEQLTPATQRSEVGRPAPTETM